MLQYLIKIIKKNDPELLDVKSEIASISKAKAVILDGLLGDLKLMTSELELVRKTSNKEGERHRGEDGKIINPNIKMTLAELKEQRTRVREIEGIKFYNQMQRDIEYTPMEIFVQSADDQLAIAMNDLDEAQKAFESVLNYFGEDEKMPTSDFFGTLFAFLESFETAKEHVERLETIRVSFILTNFSEFTKYV